MNLQKEMVPRSEVWTELHRLLASLPGRNPLLMMGDFNCNVKSSAGLVGSCVLAPQKRHADQGELQAILQSFQLCALNTWTGSSSQHVTCRGHNFGVQIDFIFTRSVHADQTARLCAPLHFRDFSPWREGTKHYMLGASVPTFPGWRKPLLSIRPKFDKQSLIASIRERDARCQQLRHAFADYIAMYPGAAPDLANNFCLGCAASFIL